MSKYPQALKPGKVSTDRYDVFGKIKKMCEADGYVMARRPSCAPFVMSLGAWELLAKTPEAGAKIKVGGSTVYSVGEGE
ncbi:hypothetical protein NBRC3280_3424 [Acetobacter pasteurianus NBRC 3280]|uniref:Uncharacterized protein n=1 Tax=Acetobacter pasteurianus NBRC 3278 TaxID=1226660 RepID=A0A401X9F8_ACEPA